MKHWAQPKRLRKRNIYDSFLFSLVSVEKDPCDNNNNSNYFTKVDNLHAHAEREGTGTGKHEKRAKCESQQQQQQR